MRTHAPASPVGIIALIGGKTGYARDKLRRSLGGNALRNKSAPCVRSSKSRLILPVPGSRILPVNREKWLVRLHVRSDRFGIMSFRDCVIASDHHLYQLIIGIEPGDLLPHRAYRFHLGTGAEVPATAGIAIAIIAATAITAWVSRWRRCDVLWIVVDGITMISLPRVVRLAR